MPLYHFHLRDAGGLQRDEDGLPLEHIEAAYLLACRTIPDLAADLLRAGRDPMACTFVIADADDRPLMEVPFRERVRDAPRPPPGPAEPGACCQIERAHRLIADVRVQHERLRGNLDRMRALMDECPPPKTTRP